MAKEPRWRRRDADARRAQLREMNERTRAERAEHMRLLAKDPSERQRRAQGMEAQWRDPEMRQKMIDNSLASPASIEARQKNLKAAHERLRALEADPDFRKRRNEAIRAAIAAKRAGADGEIAAALSPVCRHRLLRGWSLADLASRTGIHASYLSRLENGRQPLTGRMAERLARAFEIEPSELLPEKVTRHDTEAHVPPF